MAAKLRSGKGNSQGENVKRFLSSAPVRDTDHRLCGCCRIKGFVSQDPLDSRLHGAHRRYPEKRGCGIIHDLEKADPRNAHRNRTEKQLLRLAS